MTDKFNLCVDCSLCAVVHTAGFISETHYFCTQRTDEVTTDDGCTFGSKGEPQNATLYPDVVVTEPAVYGYYE